MTESFFLLWHNVYYVFLILLNLYPTWALKSKKLKETSCLNQDVPLSLLFRSFYYLFLNRSSSLNEPAQNRNYLTVHLVFHPEKNSYKAHQAPPWFCSAAPPHRMPTKHICTWDIPIALAPSLWPESIEGISYLSIIKSFLLRFVLLPTPSLPYPVSGKAFL